MTTHLSILQTPRLILREQTLDDLDFMAEMLGHPEVMRYYPKQYDREEAQQWIQWQRKRYELHGHGLWLVCDRESEEPRGQCGLMIQEVDGVREPEVGYMIHAPYWRNGIATEAARAVRDWAFAKRGLDRVISLIRPINTPSIGVAIKNGMSPEKETVFHGLKHIVYSVRRDDLVPR